jgi:hypothetical protein
MASLADFLLYLARNRSEAEKFRSKQSAVELMTEHGLSQEQQDLLLRGDTDAIKGMVFREFEPLSKQLGLTLVQHLMMIEIPKPQA